METMEIEPGFYWAKSNDGFKWYNLIVEIHGESPFLKIRYWNRANDNFVEDGEVDCVIWGPRIFEPKWDANARQ